jgi:hypothetical protein
MSLIDTTYFVRDCNLPAGTQNTIAASLTRYEPEILNQLLGNDIAKLALAYANPGSTQPIIDLVEGKEYTEGSYTVKWNGLKNTAKVSILAYYTYIQYLTDKSVSFQNVGAVAASVENGVNVGPSVLIQRASMSLRQLAGYPGQDIYAPSLYNFMTKHSADYPLWKFNEVKPMNMFGI